MKIVSSILLFFLGSLVPLQAQRAGHIVLVVPFENTSKSPGIEWIGESFSEVLGQRLAAEQLFVIRRDDRVYAFDRLGIPSNLRPSRATLYRLAEEMDVDFVVVGSYAFDGRTFTARAQVMDMRRVHLSPEAVESGGLAQLLEIQNAVSWDMLRNIDPATNVSKNAYVSSMKPLRLDALENYIRGTLATDRAMKVKYYKDALRVDPEYWQAMFQLGRTYFDNKEYESAASWLNRTAKSEAIASEANFYLGMSYFYTGNFEKAEQAFAFVASRVPLIEVYNNLGVVAARRGQKNATDYFERVVQADSRDPDYRFNLAVTLARNGDLSGAVKQLKEGLAIKPQDSEAKAVLDALNLPSRPATFKLPLERIKRNYDETSYRQLAMEIQNANEERHATLAPAQHAAIHIQRGQDFMKQGSPDQAESEFREAILLNQSNVAAHSGLADALEAQDQLTDARNEAQAANRIRFTAEAFTVLARIDMKESKLESARDNVDRALKVDPADATAVELKKTIIDTLAQKPKSSQSE